MEMQWPGLRIWFIKAPLSEALAILPLRITVARASKKRDMLHPFCINMMMQSVEDYILTEVAY
jgi:hypothetical protein